MAVARAQIPVSVGDMSNKKVTCKASISYIDADGQSATLPQKTIDAEYQAQVHGGFDIPDTTVAGDFVIPFGSIAKATAVLIENRTGQAIDLAINGGDVGYEALADGKDLLFIASMLPGGSTPISNITATTGTTQDGAGVIAFHIWGDPTES